MMSNAKPRRRVASKPKPLPEQGEVAALVQGKEREDLTEDGTPLPVQDSFQGMGILPTVPLKRETSSFAALSRKEKLSLLLHSKQKPSKSESAEELQSSDDDDQDEDEYSSYSTAVPPPSRRGGGRGGGGGAGGGGGGGAGGGGGRGGGRGRLSKGARAGKGRSPAHTSSGSGAPPQKAREKRAPRKINAFRSRKASPPIDAETSPNIKASPMSLQAHSSMSSSSSEAISTPMSPSIMSAQRMSASMSLLALDHEASKKDGKKSKQKKSLRSKTVSREQEGEKLKKSSKQVPAEPSLPSIQTEQLKSAQGKKEIAEDDNGQTNVARLPKKPARSASQTLSAASQKLSAPFRMFRRLSPRAASAAVPLERTPYTAKGEAEDALESSSSAETQDVGKSERKEGAFSYDIDVSFDEEELQNKSSLDLDDASNEETLITSAEPELEAALAQAIPSLVSSALHAPQAPQASLAPHAPLPAPSQTKQAQAPPGGAPAASAAASPLLKGAKQALALQQRDAVFEQLAHETTQGESYDYGDSALAKSYDDGHEAEGLQLSLSDMDISFSRAPKATKLIASGYDLEKLQDGHHDDHVHIVDRDSTTEDDEDEAGDWDGYSYIEMSKITNARAVDGDDADANEVVLDEEPSRQETGMNWNNLFQEAREKLNDLERDADLDVKISAHKRMAYLTANFEYTAATFGKVIIAEKSLPNSAKSIPPFDCGGRVGGEKFLVHGVLFKFAIDVNNILCSDESAMKIAGHELKALNSLISLGEQVQDLHYPMMALIDYRGYRLVALSQLPISGATLALGSSDAGRTVYHSDALLLERTMHACRLLNLKGHHVGRRSSNAWVPGPVDLEGHVGTDGRRYVLDFARLFPPDVPKKEHRCGYLYRLLRPELVKAWSTPLCSDTYSKFVSQYPEEALQHKAEVKAAVDYMTGTVIPEFATLLAATDLSLLEHSCFVLAFHRQGINLRYMGVVRQLLGKESKWSDYILIEMIARTFKWRLRAALREAKADGLDLPSDVPHRMAAVCCFNQIFSSPCPAEDDALDTIWADWLPQQLELRFPGGLFEEELSSIGYLRRHFFTIGSETCSSSEKHILCRLFDRLDSMSDVTFTDSAKTRFSGEVSAFLDEASHSMPFDFIHIASFSPMIKHLSLMDVTMGKLMQMRAKRLDSPQHTVSCTDGKASPGAGSSSQSSRQCTRGATTGHKAAHANQKSKVLRQLSLQSFERALVSDPSCIPTLLLCAGNYAQLGNLQRAKIYYRLAKNVDETNPVALYKYARFLHEYTTEDEEAEDMYLAAIRHSESQHAKPLMYYAKFLATKGDNKEAAHSLFSLAEDAACEKTKPKIERIREEVS